MMAATGCDGVVIGRGCLGRPWLFAELSAAFTGTPEATPPTLGEVAAIIAATASCSPPISARTRACATSASTSPGTCTASPPAPSCAGHWPWSRRWPNSDAARAAGPGDPVSRRGDGSARAAGITRRGGAARGLADRSRRLHGAGGRRRHALRRLIRAVRLGVVSNRDELDITSLRMSQYDMSLVRNGLRRRSHAGAVTWKEALRTSVRSVAHGGRRVGGR